MTLDEYNRLHRSYRSPDVYSLGSFHVNSISLSPADYYAVNLQCNSFSKTP